MQSTHPEIWKPVVGYEGAYEVSNLGRVRSLDRHVPHPRGGKQWVAGRMLRAATKANKHLYVGLRKEGALKLRYIHSLVLEAFSGPCPDGNECRHLDGDPTNNQLENLKWGTRSENVHDTVAHGVHAFASRTHCKRGHLLSGENLSAAMVKRGYRNCRACHREHSFSRRHGVVFSPSRADHFFSQIMSG